MNRGCPFLAARLPNCLDDDDDDCKQASNSSLDDVDEDEADDDDEDSTTPSFLPEDESAILCLLPLWRLPRSRFETATGANQLRSGK